MLEYTESKVYKFGVFSSPYFLVPELNTEVYRLNLLIQFELVFSSPNFPVFGLNTEIYSIDLFIQSK